MKTILLVLVLALAVPLALGAYDRADFDRVVDFSVTIQSLDGLTEAQGRALASRVLLLDGTVASLQFLDPEEDTFAVEVELVAGEWVGLEDVKMYRCRVRFEGREFFRQFPRRAPKNPSAEQVRVHDRLLAAARIARRTTDAEGRPLWVLTGLRARPLR